MTAISETASHTTGVVVPDSLDDAPPRWRRGVGDGRIEYWTFEDARCILGLVGNRVSEPDNYTAELLGRLRRNSLPPGPFSTLRDAQDAIERAWINEQRTWPQPLAAPRIVGRRL